MHNMHRKEDIVYGQNRINAFFSYWEGKNMHAKCVCMYTCAGVKKQLL